MLTANVETSNRLSSRAEVVDALMTMLGALDAQFPAGSAQFPLGDTCAVVGAGIADRKSVV